MMALNILQQGHRRGCADRGKGGYARIGLGEVSKAGVNVGFGFGMLALSHIYNSDLRIVNVLTQVWAV